jgi:hypothetical protein
VVADTREQVADLNAAIHDRLIAAGQVDAAWGLVTAAGERLCVGDKVATRRNDYDLGVANRDTWTVTALDDDGTLHLTGQAGTRVVPVGYAAQYIELAYATTCYGAQGETVPTAHLVLGEHTGAAAAYVAMTRGRETNTAHLVADSLQDARGQWIQTFTRDRADLGHGQQFVVGVRGLGVLESAGAAHRVPPYGRCWRRLVPSGGVPRRLAWPGVVTAFGPPTGR